MNKNYNELPNGYLESIDRGIRAVRGFQGGLTRGNLTREESLEALAYELLHADAVVIAWYAKGMPEDIRALEGAPLSYGPNLPVALMQILSPEGVFPGSLPIKLPDVDADGQIVEQTLKPAA